MGTRRPRLSQFKTPVHTQLYVYTWKLFATNSHSVSSYYKNHMAVKMYIQIYIKMHNNHILYVDHVNAINIDSGDKRLMTF